MKSPSKYFRELERSIRSTRAIASSVNPLFCNTKLDELKVKSYILLSHAAIEQYLEDLSFDVALNARNLFVKNGYITKCLIGLISSGILDEVSDGKGKKKISGNVFRNLDQFSSIAYSKYLEVIEGNHGIKKSNLMDLFLPLGVNPEIVDISTVAILESFGQKRGDIAHKAKISKTHTLSEIDSDLKQIVEGLRNFDAAACGSLRSRMKNPAAVA